MARAARLTGLRATIFMPPSAPWPKIAATREDGADVRLEGAVVDDTIELARAYAEQAGATWVHPFDDPVVIAGQGTVGLEIAQDASEPEVVVVPVGGGGLIAGVAVALAHARPGVRVIGVEAAGAASMRAALDAGRTVALDRIATIADGIAVKSVCDLTLAHVQKYVEDIVTVTEDEISRALILLLERAKAVVEPAGAVGLAAILAGKIPGSGTALAILSGGNVDPMLLTRLIEHGLSAVGRYLVLRILLVDRPGALAHLTDAIATMGVNILDVEHHRIGMNIGVEKVDVMVTLGTQDEEHRETIVRALRAQGFSVERAS